MVAAIKGSNSNPTPKNGYQIGGIQVEFPYKPYGTQLAFMSRVIQTLDRALRDGHSHALLESPTGTGKSLSLLCSVLAWQQNYIANNLSDKLPNSRALTDPLSHGGGFVPETQPSGSATTGNLDPASKGRIQKKKSAPTVYYASRTHSQVSQVIREYRKTAYRVPMALLASRKHYCTNPCVRGKENIDEECKLLLKGKGCTEFKNAHKVKYHPTLQKGGCHEVHDIEDVVKVGQIVKGCSYYAARAMADDAQLVFCPYNYVINPVIRGAMEIDIKGAIIILDEAHNIEDITRDAGSVDIEEDILLKLQTELEQLCINGAMIYQPLFEMIQDLISWMDCRKSTLEKHGFQSHIATWTGEKALSQLQEANISQQCFPVLLDCATKAIKAASDTEEEVPHLSGMSVLTLEGLFSSLTYFFSRNGSHVSDYQLVLQRRVKKVRKTTLENWTHSLSLWCLNPAVVFKDIADLSLSIILTSGTLSPTKSFSSELGVQFGTYLEAPHVIDVESQVWAAVISSGPSNYPLNASYKTADSYAFQDELGKSLEEIVNITPGGSLVFFPSYKLMEKLCDRWQETGQWSRLNARKSLYVEPRGSQEDLEPVLKNYYDEISGVRKPTIRTKKRFKKTNDESKSSKVDKEGAAFLAVCRGKVSEGIDFSDDNARVVILVGIPFPNIKDIQVSLKKKYNDLYKASKDLLSGSEWYCHQAFRALNQAVGRCIRHKDDYGAIILLEERFLEERNRVYISKWLRKSIRQYENFDQSLEGLKSFFRDAKEKVEERRLKRLHDPDKGNGSTVNINRFTQEAILKIKQSEYDVPETFPQTKHFHFPQIKPQDDSFLLPVQAKQDSQGRKELSDLECCDPKDSWYSGKLSLAFSDEDPDIFVEETLTEHGTTAGSPASLSKEENSHSTMIEASVESPDQSLSHPPSSANQFSSKDKPIIIVTPEKHTVSNTYSMIEEIESSLNWSTSSHAQKRKSVSSEVINIVDTEELETSNAQMPDSTSFKSKLVEYREATRKIEFGLETNYGVNNSDKLSNPGSCATCTDPASLMDKSLQISCSLCKTPLGLPENHLYVNCSQTSSSKVHLVYLSKGMSKDINSSPLKSVPVIVTDASSVDRCLFNRNAQGPHGQGIWCKEDGCVFNNIFCPFCTTSNNCLGVQILATDAANVQLLNKILFYLDRLEIKDYVVKQKSATKDQGVMQVNGLAADKMAKLNSIERFAYSPQQHDLGGWRSTKSKLMLPKDRRAF